MKLGERIRESLPYLQAAAGVTLVDQAVKYRAEKHPGKFKGVIHNTGFVGERLKERPDIVRKTAVILTALGIVRLVLMKDSTKGDIAIKTGWAFVMGGAISNTLDRVIRKYVVDYIPCGKYVYNLGDISIYSGLAITVAGAFSGGKEKE